MTIRELVTAWVSLQNPDQIADLLLKPKADQKTVLKAFAASLRQTREDQLTNADANTQIVKSNLTQEIQDLQQVESQL